MSPKQKQESHTLLKGHQLLLLTSFPCLKHRFSQFLLLWLPVVHLLQIARCGQLLPTLLPPSVPSQELSRTLLLETGQGVLELRMSAARGVANSKNSQGVRAVLPPPPPPTPRPVTRRLVTAEYFPNARVYTSTQG